MSSGKKIVLEHFRKEDSQLEFIEEKIVRLETATKQKLREFSDSSKKAGLYVERAYDLSGVRRTLFETQLKHMPQRRPETVFSSPSSVEEQKEEEKEVLNDPPATPPKHNPSRAENNEELQRLRNENRQLLRRLNHDTIDKLEE